MGDTRNPLGLHDPVLDKLGLEIASGELPDGRVLTLDWIQERFGVSRTVAREAMRVLENMGMVRSRRRVGITVRPIAEWNVFDPKVIWWRLAGPGRNAQLRTLTEMRIAVEPLAAGAAARAATAPQRARVVELAAALRDLGEAAELTEFMERDVEFHDLLLRASGNEMFGALADPVAAVLRGRTQLGLMPHKPVPEALDLHDAVAAAVASGRSEDAENAMRELLAEVRTAMLPRLRRDRPPPRASPRQPPGGLTAPSKRQGRTRVRPPHTRTTTRAVGNPTPRAHHSADGTGVFGPRHGVSPGLNREVHAVTD
ncbi:GntR family transcriptional regulator [Glycomyces artemisiae]|uniref:GntR family transcriptional regulator n=1 Tax=Glycomyces artemisiae TaxID=1076443 RepID=A0A2T0UX05_9ACTN|nr:FCD domain-containing protein [Glycomyces artemisiae]PRY62460.1 GntR family transcriptional regulator [Glycomyces artemisiae]